jgi:hypothetical protein
MKKQITQILVIVAFFLSAKQIKALYLKHEVTQLQNGGISLHRSSKTDEGHISSFFFIDSKSEKIGLAVSSDLKKPTTDLAKFILSKIISKMKKYRQV